MLVENLKNVEDEIQLACDNAKRQTGEVTMIAVTKSVNEVQTRKIAELGITNLAENRVDNFLAKKNVLKDFTDIQWHFIGNLQRRKVKSIINEIDFFHALDRLELAEEIQKRALKKINCFIEVNITGEQSKQGIDPDELITFIRKIKKFDCVVIIGLMTMAPRDASEELLHNVFSKLKQLQRLVNQQNLSYAPCTELSMGMSSDYKVAIEEGSTFVRLGTVIFKGA